MVMILSCLGFSRAAEASFTIKFSTSGTGELNSNSLLSSVSEGGANISKFTDVTKVYGGGTHTDCIRLASSNASSGTGKFTLHFAEGKKATKVVVRAMAYNSTTGSLKISTATPATQDIKGTDAADYEFTLNPNFTWTNLPFEVAGNKRIYISAITVYYETDGPVIEKTAKPSIIGDAIFTESTQVSISAAAGASIYYTLDGTTPMTQSTAYNAPFTLSATTTVKAIAQESGKDPSEIAEATFTKKLAGDYSLVTSIDELDEVSSYIIGVKDQNAAMSNAKSTGNIQQTSATIVENMLSPTESVMTFRLEKNAAGNWAFKADNYGALNSPYIQNSTSTACKMGNTVTYFTISFDANKNIQIKSTGGRWIHAYNSGSTNDFRAYSSAASNSSEVQLYRLGTKVVQAPVISLSSDNVFVGEKVTVTIDKKNAEKVYYTTDGTTPSATVGTEYSVPFEITATTEGAIKVQAIGISEGIDPSSVAVATITVSKKEPIADGSWVVVNNASELEVGARYIIAYNGKAVSTAAVANSKLQSTDATVSNKGLLTPTDDMMVFTLGNGSATGKYILKSNNYNNSIADHYLTFGSSTSVNMTTEPSDLLLNYKTQSSADVAIQDAAGDRMLKGSNATPVVFGYYSATSGYHNVQLYKEVDSREACAMPTVTITPDAVVEGNEAKVTITAEAGASVRYTTDGTIPTATKGTEYTGEFTLTNITANTTVKAIAYAEGKKNSAVAEATVTVTLKPRMPKVTWSVDGTTYTAENDGAYEVPAGTTLTITAVNGDKVKVTNLETEQSRTLDSPQTLTVNKDMMASFASVSGDMTSDELTAIFTIKKVMPETPVITWTKDGQAMTGVNDGEYDVYAGTQITVSSKNATKIVVADSENFDGEYDAPFTFTLYNDDMFTFTGKNADGTSSGVTVAYTIVERPKEMTYALVTDASQLKAGNKYVIAYKDDDDCVAVSNDGNWSVAKNQYRPVVRDGFTIDANNVLHDRSLGTADGTVGVMVFELGGSAGAWTLTADNYIKPADGVQNADEPAPGNQVKLHEFSKGYNFSMTTENSPLKITFEGNQAKITTTEMESAGYVVKFNSNSSWIGLSKTTNDYPMVQLYGYEPLAKPEAVVVTYTKVKDGEALATEDCGEYTAINESKITVSSKNATQIDVNGTKHDAINGVYSFTSDVDEIFIVKGVNDAGETTEYTIEMLVDYEADNVMDMQTLSRKQKDRADKNVWAPVKFVGSAFIRGHYMIDEGLSEVLWIEDANGDAAAIYEFGDEFATPGHSIESNMMLKNFKVRSEDYYNATDRRIMQLISWPEDVETEVGTYDFAAWLQGQEYGTEASASNEFRLQKFHGDITFTADGGTLTVGEKSIAVTNALSFKAAGDKQSFGRTAEGSFNWLPGREWLTGQTKTNAHVIGFVMPEGNGSNLKYVVYPAQITDNAGNITDVDGVENDGDGVYVQGGVIYAPAGSRVFGLNGAQVKAVQALNGGVYVVVTPDGRAVKVLVK